MGPGRRCRLGRVQAEVPHGVGAADEIGAGPRGGARAQDWQLLQYKLEIKTRRIQYSFST